MRRFLYILFFVASFFTGNPGTDGCLDIAGTTAIAQIPATPTGAILSGVMYVPNTAPVGPPTTNLFAYYEADAGVTSSGGLVSQWNDLSPNGRNITQSTGASKPTYDNTNIISFGPTLATGNVYLSGTYSLPQWSTVYLVVRLDDVGLPAYISGDINTGFCTWNVISSNTFECGDGGGANVIAAGGTTPSVSTWYLVRFEFNGGSSICQINNQTTGTGTLGTGTVASPYIIGAINNAGTLFYSGSFSLHAAYIYQGGAPPDAALKTYTNTKWGVP